MSDRKKNVLMISLALKTLTMHAIILCQFYDPYYIVCPFIKKKESFAPMVLSMETAHILKHLSNYFN